jgi:hypothetical protein
MILAAVALIFPGAARAAGSGGPWAALPLWLFPLALAMAYDLATRRRIEPVYLVGLGLCLLAFSRVFLMEWEGWVRVGRAILVGLFPQVGGGGG